VTAPGATPTGLAWQGVPVFLVAAVHLGRLYLAPIGTPFDLADPSWEDAGPAPEDLP
jgi:hypothetical protein